MSVWNKSLRTSIHVYMKNIILCCFILCALQVNAQKLTSLIPYDTLSYVYKLDEQQIKFVLTHSTIPDTPFLFTHKFSTFPRSTFKADSLPAGYFIIAHVDDQKVFYTLQYKIPFTIQPKLIQQDVVIFLSNTSTKTLIKQADISINGTKIAYDPGYGGYSFPKDLIKQEDIDKQKVFVKIVYNKEVYMLRYYATTTNEIKQTNQPYPDRNEIYPSPGYLIFDKPMYKPLDSLRMKAFLIHPDKGYPIRKKVKVTVSEPLSNFTYTKKIKSISPGAYTWQWKIPDSLKIDRSYQVQLSYKKHQNIFFKKQSFLLNEYELNKNKYEATNASDTYFAGDDIEFYAQAKDMNGFPIEGTRIHVNVKLDQVMEIQKDTFTWSNHDRQSWFQMDTVINYDNFISLKIPNPIFPPINAKYTAEITFVDPVSYEKKVVNLSFVKYTQKEKTIFYQKEDSLFINVLSNGEEVHRKFKLYTFWGADTISAITLTSPYVYKLNSAALRALLVSADSVKFPLDINYHKLNITHIEGKRKGDSIFIAFDYPFTDDVHYKIYKANTCVKSAEARRLTFALADHSLDDYRIVLSTNLQFAITQNFYELRFVPEKNKLHIQKKVASTSLPGDSLAVELTVTDFVNKPRKKINILAYAVNAAFEEKINTPYFDVPELYQNNVDIRSLPVTDNPSLYVSPVTQQHILKPQHFKQFNLYANEYYQLKYPAHELCTIPIKKQVAQPEFSLYITHQHQLYSPKYIKVDGQLIFMSDINAQEIYSWLVDSGYHDIEFRYYNALYTLPKMKFQSHTKYVLGINYDSIRKVNSVFRKTDSLSIIIPTTEEKEMLYNSLLVMNPIAFDTFEIISTNQNQYRKFYGVNYLNRLSIDGELYQVYGPFAGKKTIPVKINNRVFSMYTGLQNINFYDPTLRDCISKKKEKIIGEIFNFREINLQMSSVLSLRIPDTMVVPPIHAPAIVHSDAIQKIQDTSEENIFQQYSFQQGDTYCNLSIRNNADTNYIKSIWMINKNNFQHSEYISQVQRSDMQFTKYNVNDAYDIYLFMNKNRVVICKNKKFNNNDFFIINAAQLHPVELHKDMLVEPLKIYAELNYVPLLPFYQTPLQTKEKLKKTNTMPRNNIYVHGLITADNQMPVEGAIVYAEINGKYVMGGITNAQGVFEILDMYPATYQFKIFHPDYRVQYFEPILLEKGNSYELNTNLSYHGIEKPIFESLQPEYQFMAFANQEKTQSLLLTIHDKQNRELLQGEVKLICNQQVVKTYLVQNGQIEIPFPDDLSKSYQLNISKPGYTSIHLQGLFFKPGYRYVLHTFIGLTKHEIVQSKRYQIEMENQLPDINESFGNDHIQVSVQHTNEKFGRLEGMISSIEGNPLTYATIQLIHNKNIIAVARTNESGVYNFASIAAGKYDLRVTYAGYITSKIEGVQISAHRLIQMNIQLHPKNSGKDNQIQITAYKKLIETRYQMKDDIVVNEPSEKNISYTVNNSPGRYETYQYATAPSTSYSASSPRQYSSADIQAVQANYYVDGLAVSVTKQKKLELKEAMMNQAAPAVRSTMLEEVVQHKYVSTIRKNFSDAAYWVPNLITNKQGKAAFTIKLPDNITRWNSYFVAGGKRWMHGIDSAFTRVYKPLQTTLFVPAYMYEGDRLQAVIRINNLTKDTLPITTAISIQGKKIKESKHQIVHTIIDSVQFTAQQSDTLEVDGGLTYKDFYKDIERMKIPVMPVGLQYYSSQSLQMDADSLYILHIPETTVGTIQFHNSLFEKIEAVVQALHQYEFGCVEQTASKLKACIIQDRLQRKLSLPSKFNKEIYQLLARLQDMQLNNGSFGWWRNYAANDRMSIYVMENAFDAMQAGYNNNLFYSVRDYILANFSYLSASDQIYAFHVLLKSGFTDAKMMAQYQQIKPELMNTTDKIYYYQNKLLLKENVSTSDLYAIYLSVQQQLYRPFIGNFFYDNKADLFKAYQLFAHTPAGAEFVQYFKKQLLAGQFDQHLHTFSTAALVDVLAGEALLDTAKKITATLRINDTIQIKQYPYTIPIKHQTYRIQHNGGSVFMQTAEKKYTKNPTMHDSVFAVQTSFKQLGKVVNKLKSGEAATLQVHLNIFSKGENVMLEVPIPSGCKIIQKQTQQNSNYYVEYFKHKVVFFFNTLHMGTQDIDIPILPVFKGICVVPPAQISLMYYPFVFGNNTTSTIDIQ